jgi:hypothetical protein
MKKEYSYSIIARQLLRRSMTRADCGWWWGKEGQQSAAWLCRWLLLSMNH